MTTLGDVIERTRRRLLTSMRSDVNVLQATIDSDDVALTFAHEVQFAEGARLSIDLEDMLVLPGVSSTGCSVIRAMDGSIGATHTAGTIVRINAPWTDFEIANAINEELDSLSGAGLFQVRTVELSYDTSTQGYNLSGLTKFMNVWRVRYRVPGSNLDWPVLNPLLYRVDLASETDDFASGASILLREGGFPGQQVRVSYRSGFTRLAAKTDDITVVSGLHDEAHGLLDVGAAMRLLSGLDVVRALATSQANPRRGDEVPPSTGARAIEPLGRQYDRDLERERARLMRRYPMGIS